jgi:hypothetical protein
MSSKDRKELADEVYDSLLYTVGAIVIGMVGKKFLKDPLGTPSRPMDALKLAGAMSGGLMITKFIQQKGWLPTDPFTKKK